MSNYYEGSGPVSANEQAKIAYAEMRHSLVQYAAIELKMTKMAERGIQLNAVEDAILTGQRTKWAERIQVFAAVYQVEIDVARRGGVDSV